MMLRRTAGEDKRSCAGQYETRDLFFHNVDLLWYVMLPNNQLTDGGPCPPPELPDGVAGPPFGGAPGSGFVSLAWKYNPRRLT